MSGMFKTRLADCLRRQKKIRGIVLCSFSVFPPLLDDLFKEVPKSVRIFMLFQRWSYQFQEKQERTQKVRKEFVAQFLAKPRFAYVSFQYKQGMAQFHLKSLFVLYDDDFEYIQYSQNMDWRRGVNDELLYVGKPEGVYECVDGLCRLVEHENAPLTYLTQNGDRNQLSALLHRIAGMKRPTAKNAKLLLQTPEMGQKIVDLAKNVLVRASADKTLYYDTEPSYTEMIMHFPFANITMVSSLCETVVGALCASSAEKKNTLVRMATYSTPNDLLLHESWVCHLREGRLQWFFLTSCNMTLPSWGAAAKNYEVGLFLFLPIEHVKETALLDHIRKPFETNRNVYVTAVNCPTEPLRFDRDAPPKPSRRNRNHSCAPQKSIRYDEDGPTGTRFFSALDALKNHILPRLRGLHDLYQCPEMVNSHIIRWALFHYVFQGLGSKLRHYKASVISRRLVHSVLSKAAVGALCNKVLTLNLLTDLYMRWFTVTNFYDPRIMATDTMPEVDQTTLRTIADGKIGERFIEESSQRLRGDFGCTPYDTLTFLIQNMYSDQYCWWNCEKGHDFYLRISRMMTTVMPSCMVCTRSDDIRLCYEILQAQEDKGVSHVTVEFPLKKKGGGLMHYDIFFRLDDEVCAVEIDDASHYRGAMEEEYTLIEEEDMVQVDKKAVRRAAQDFQTVTINRDAVKNVISSVMGIHMLRILCMKKRLNLVVVLETTISSFIDNIQQHRTHLLRGLRSVCGLQKSLERRVAPNKKRGFTASELLWPRHKRPPQLGPDVPVPVSMVFSTDVPDGKAIKVDAKALLRVMAREGMRHPCLKNTTKIPLSKVYEDDSLHTNVANVYWWSNTKGSDRLALTDKSLVGHVIRKNRNEFVVESQSKGGALTMYELNNPNAKLRLAPKDFQRYQLGDKHVLRVLRGRSTVAKAPTLPHPAPPYVLDKTSTDCLVPGWRVPWADKKNRVDYTDGEKQLLGYRVDFLQRAVEDNKWYMGIVDPDDPDTIVWVKEEQFKNVREPGGTRTLWQDFSASRNRRSTT